MRLSVLIHAITSLICLAAASAALAGRSTDAKNLEGCQGVTSGIEEVSPSEPTGVGAGIVLDEHLLTNGSRDHAAQTTQPSAAVPVHWIAAAAWLSIYQREWFCLDLSAGQRGCF